MPTTSVRSIDLILPGSYGKETLSNDGMQNLALGISGAATIALTSTDVTLTATQSQHFILIFTGTLTANVNVIVPAESRVFVADNRTTGSFTVTVKTASGGGVAVDQSARTLIYCDGTTVYPVASGTGGGGGSGAPTDATYLVQSAHALLTGERAVTDTPTVAWDFATAGQARAQIPDGAVTYAKLQDVTSSRLLGRFAAGAGDAQEITLGSGLALDGSGVLTATPSGAQPLDATLTALAGMSTAADTFPYFTGVDTAAVAPVTPFARTVLDDASQATMQTTLGLVPGTHVQAFDATLSALAGVTTGADRLPFFTGTDLASTTTLTPFARSLLDDTTAAQARATLEIAAGGSVSFLDLTDTDPTTYSGQAGKVVLVNPGETGLEFGTASGGLDTEGVQDVVGAMATDSTTIDYTYDDTAGTFTSAVKDASLTEAKLSLSDVTTQDASTTQHGLLRKLSGTATQYLDGTGAWSTPAGGGGTFLSLSDTPDTYAGQAGTGVVVNGTATGLEFTTALSASYDLGGTWAGTLPASQVLLRYPFPRSVTFPSGLTASQANAAIAATASTVIDLRKNGTSVGSMTFAAAGTVATFTMASAQTFAAGDVLSLHAPATPDSTLATVGWSLAGTRTTAPGEMGATTYLGLLDTPDAYTGQGGNLVTVNSGATALDFTPLTTAGRALLDDADTAAQRTTLGLGTLAVQHADNVAITDGRISLGGHAPTGVLDVQGSVNAGGGLYPGARLWPVAPSGATAVHALAVEAATGAGLAGAQFVGYVCVNQPAMSTVRAVDLNISSGTGRYNLYAVGTAQNYFAGNVGIANPTPSYPLDVTGQARMTGSVSIGGAVTPSVSLQIHWDKVAKYGIVFQPSNNDAGTGHPVTFMNIAGGAVGTITTTGSATAYNTSSDARLKHSIQPLTNTLDVLRALRPVCFRWNADDSADEGFLAHELQQVVPQAVSGLPDEVHPDGSVKPQQVDASKLIPLLTSAIQAVLVQVEALTARVQSLEEQLGI